MTNKNKSKSKYDDMRETKEVDWCGRKVVVREILVTELMQLTKKEVNPETSDKEIIQSFITQLCSIATDIDAKELIEYPPSKIKKLIKHIESVNEDFFWIMASFGLTKNIIKTGLESLWRNFIAMESLNVFKS